MKVLCILALVCLAAAKPHRGRGHGRRGSSSSSSSEDSSEDHPLKISYRECMKREMKWPELGEKNCTEFNTEIQAKLTQLFGDDAKAFFENKYDVITGAIENGETEVPCHKIACFKREAMAKVLTQGMPNICKDRPEPEEEGMCDLFNSQAEKADVVEGMIDGYCYKTEKLSFKIHMKIVMENLGLPDHGGHDGGRKMHHMKEKMRKHCKDVEITDDTCIGVLNFDDYVTSMFSENWDVEQKMQQIHELEQTDRKAVCKAKGCFEKAFSEKLNETAELTFPDACHGIWKNRSSILQQHGMSPIKMKLFSCMGGFKIYFERKMADTSIVCDGSATQFMTDLYSGDANTIDRAINATVEEWKQKAANAPAEPPKDIPDEAICKMRAVKAKLETEEYELPEFCTAEMEFDTDITAASTQDVKILVCHKLERFADKLNRRAHGQDTSSE